MGLLAHLWLSDLSGSSGAGYCNFYRALYLRLVKLIKQYMYGWSLLTCIQIIGEEISAYESLLSVLPYTSSSRPAPTVAPFWSELIILEWEKISI
jgi:hypothetical protein